MFDEIQCKVPLPAKRGIKSATQWKNHTFQTKDLENFLGHYEIRKSGLWVKEATYKDIDLKKEKKCKGWCFPCMEVESEKWVKENYSGYIRFYDFINDVDEENDAWVEFGGLFDKGKLQGKIELLEWKKESNFERKENDKKLKLKVKERKDYEKKWRYKYFGHYWNHAIRFIFRVLNRFLNWKREVTDWILKKLWKLESRLKF